MTNLAILCCLDANDVCTGAGCLRALRERRTGDGASGLPAVQPLQHTP